MPGSGYRETDHPAITAEASLLGQALSFYHHKLPASRLTHPFLAHAVAVLNGVDDQLQQWMASPANLVCRVSTCCVSV
jgi:hypothetical protein